MGKGNYLSRVPYNSLIGFILVLVGGGVLCGTLYCGLTHLEEYFSVNFFHVYSLSYIRIASVVNGALAILLAFLILIFSVLVNNATRGRIYRGDRCIMGGRCSAALFLCITYGTIVIWLLFLAFLVVPTFCWIMFNSICTEELADVWHGPGLRRPGPDSRVAPTLSELRERKEFPDETYTARLAYYYQNPDLGYIPSVAEQLGTPIAFENLNIPSSNRYLNHPNRFLSPEFTYIFNLTNYGIYVKPWSYDPSYNIREAITTLDEFARFCDEVMYLGPLFICSLGGALFILLGLTLFVASLSAYYTRLKLTKELTDFRQSVALRSPKNHDQAAYF